MKISARIKSILMPTGFDPYIHISVIVLAIFGMLMVTSATMGVEAGNYFSLIFTVIKQGVFTVLGFIAMIIAGRWASLKHLKRYVLAFAAIIGILLFICRFFPPVNGAYAWIRIRVGSNDISLQPSEFAKVAMIIVIAMYLGDIKQINKEPFSYVRPVAIVLAIYLLEVLFLQSDTGSAVIIAGISFVCFEIPSFPKLRRYQRPLFLIVAFGIILLVFMMTPIGVAIVKNLPISQYQINRFLSAVNPFVDQYASGYQLVNGLISFASGGFTGVGFGNSVRKYTNFPQANSDYILAIVCEELGFLGFLIIFVGYAIIIYQLFKYAMKMNSEQGKIILVGTAMYILIHFVLNVGGVTGLIPLTGVPLLMISAGGSSSMAIMLSIGISQAIITQYKKGLIA